MAKGKTSQNGTGNSTSNRQQNYVTANRFYVEIEGQLSASFRECSGLGFTIKNDKRNEGGVNNQQRVILGQAQFSDVTLKRGMTDDLRVFWGWISDTLQEKKKKRRNVNILVFNQAGETMQCWTLIAAIPVAWKAPALKADGNEVAIEELTIAYEGLKVAKAGGGGATMLPPGRDNSGYFPSN
jgi:phage tail-like protein